MSAAKTYGADVLTWFCFHGLLIYGSTKQIGPQEMDSSSLLSATATLTNNSYTIYAVGKLFDAYSLEYSR